MIQENAGRFYKISLGSCEAAFRASIGSCEGSASFTAPDDYVSTVWAWKLCGFRPGRYDLITWWA